MNKLTRKHIVRRAGGWLVTLLLIYLVLIGCLALAQRHLLYAPGTDRFVPAAWGLEELQPLIATTEDGLRITSWYAPAQSREKLTIVFFQGNAGQLGYRNYKIKPWIEAGYGVLLVGYRGFGNPGSPSEEGLYMDAEAAIKAIEAGSKTAPPVLEDGLVFYGEALGTGVAVQMATEYGADGLILESPFTSLPDVGAERYPLAPVRWLLRDRYDEIGKIHDVHMPLLVIHGDKDEVVPVSFARQLFDAANAPKQALWLPDADHSTVYNLEAQQAVMNFIAGLPTEQLLNAPK